MRTKIRCNAHGGCGKWSSNFCRMNPQTPMIRTYEDLFAELNKRRVAYIVVGGLAVALNGFVRMTEDVDILVDDSAENVERLLKCLSHFGSGSARELTVSDFTKEEGAIRVQEDFPLDIFTMMRGMDYREAAKTENIYEHESGAIPYLSKENLCALKQNSLREKDRLDVSALKNLHAEKPTIQINDLHERVSKETDSET